MGEGLSKDNGKQVVTSVEVSVLSSTDTSTDDEVMRGQVVPDGIEQRVDRAFRKLNSVYQVYPSIRPTLACFTCDRTRYVPL